MRRSFILFAMVTLALFACKKQENELGELTYNPFIVDVPNPVTIDSIVSYPKNPTESYFAVHFTLNRDSVEANLAAIDSVVVDIKNVGQTSRPDTPVSVTTTETGGVASPRYAYTLSQYEVNVFVRFRGGGVSVSTFREVDTPGF